VAGLFLTAWGVIGAGAKAACSCSGFGTAWALSSLASASLAYRETDEIFLHLVQVILVAGFFASRPLIGRGSFCGGSFCVIISLTVKSPYWSRVFLRHVF
jgi:hypothetical protein